jgi:site-specific DNA recombinase
MKKAFVIIRVSSEDQLKGYGPEVQWEDDILPNASLLGLEVNEEFKRVIQESATGWERTKFEASVREAVQLYKHGQVQALLFPRVDRETRFIFGSMPLLAEVIQTGLDVYFAREKLFLNPNDPESVERYLNKATQAQAYIETMKYNTMKAKQKLLKQGFLPQGTGRGLYGYRWDRVTKKRIPLPYEVKVVEKAFLMRADHIKTFNIARTLNDLRIPTKTGGKWHPRTIHRMLTNPAYVGITYYGRTRGSRKTKLIKQPESEWILLPDTTPPIISRELFDRVQEIIRQDSEMHRAKAKHDYLLRGHLVCGYCGSPLVGSFMNHSIRYYHCRGTYPTTTRQSICNARYIRAEHLENVTWDSIKKVLSEPEIVLAGISEQLESERAVPETSLDKEIQKLKRRLKSYDPQEKRLIQMLRYEEVTQDTVLDEINQLKKERESDKQQLDNYVLTRERIDNLEKAELQLKDYCQRLHRNLDNATYQDKREVLEMLAIKVIATPERTDVHGIIPLETTSAQSPDNSLSLLTTGQTSA